MTSFHAAWLAREQGRWQRNDAHRWLRPDHARFEKPQEIERKYNPNQPRVPAGNSDGGQWTSGGGLHAGLSLPAHFLSEELALFEQLISANWAYDDDEAIRLAQLDGILDSEGNPYYRPGGHHEVPRAVYEKWNLSDETRRVFEKATTGRVPPMILRTTPDGTPMGNFWSGPNGPHAHYNNAVEELGNRFALRNNTTPSQLTPDHAYAILKEVRESDDFRIRSLNSTVRLIRRLFPLRTGRGTE